MPTTTGLPSELWTEVLGHLSRTDQQTCLHLSRLHRVLALRCLFPMVHVYFGLHGSDKLLYIEQIQQEEAAARRSFDILDAIIFEPAFAGAVKKVVVHAFCAHSAIFEIGLLVRALKAIENLRSFVWIGIKPRIPDSVVNALQERCPSLREFNIDEYRFYDLPSSRFVNIGYNSDLSAFTGLTHVSIASDEFDDDDTRGVLALISANARTLTHLVGTDNVVWPSLRAFSSLTHLEIVRCDQTDNLPLVFQHAPQLRSLDLPDAHPGVFRALAASPNTLPELESFRLSVVNSLALDDAMVGVDDPTPADAGAYEAVFRFLENKRANLRRLALNVEGATHADVHRFIEFVRTIPRLDVLGVTIYSRHMSVLTFERFGDALSDRLQMFSVSFVWNLNDILVEEFMPLYNRLCELPRLEVLRLQMGDLRLSPGDIAHDCAHLHTLALGQSSIWTIDRRQAALARALAEGHVADERLERWSYRRAKHRGPEDFLAGGEDAEWLLRPLVGELTGPD